MSRPPRVAGSPLPRGRARLALMIALGSLLVATPAPASAHVDLLGSTPGANSRVEEPPDQVELRFSEAVDPALAAVVVGVHDREGQRVSVTLGSDPRTLVATVPDGLADAGPWTVDFRVTSVDGHPIEGRVEFVVLEPAASTSSPRDSTPTEGSSRGIGSTSEVPPDAGAADEAGAAGGFPAWVVLLLAGAVAVPLVAVATRRSWRPSRSTAE